MEFTLRLFCLLLKIVSWISAPIFAVLRIGRVKKVPPIENKLLMFSATTLAEKIRKREVNFLLRLLEKLKCEEVIRAYIARIKEVNVIINAVVEDRFHDALEDAVAADRLLDGDEFDEQYLRETKPLYGVPVTIKESCSLKEMSYAVGSKYREGLRAVEDGEVVDALKTAGAIPLLVSNTPEYCFYWETHNLITGRTKNPYNINYSSAGSSGGEGALLGAAASVIGIGSDVAGSIRLPGLYNGVFGHKPTANLLAKKGHFPVSYDELVEFSLSLGPLVRFADDLPLVMSVLARNSINYNDVDLSNIRVFHQEEFDACPSRVYVSSDIKRLIQQSVKHLNNVCKANINDYKFDFKNSLEMCTLLYAIKDFPNLLEHKDKKSNLFLELLKASVSASRHSLGGLIFSIMRACNGCVFKERQQIYSKELNELRNDLLNKLQNDGVLICPTFPSAALQHNEFVWKFPSVQYLTIFNILGLPCTHIPMGLNKKRLPIGVQVVAAPHQDKLCLAVARALEKGFGGWIPPS